MAKAIAQENVLAAINQVEDPSLNKSLLDLSMVRDIQIEDGKVSLKLVLISPAYPFAEQLEAELREKVGGLVGVEAVEIEKAVEVPVDANLAQPESSKVKTVIAVASGKGGVGKSTVAVNLAVALAQEGANVGLMDADVYGPNIPMMMGVDALPPQQQDGKIEPAKAHGVKLISIGFLVKPDQPIVWRGPMLHSAIQQFVKDVKWGDLDYLVVDLPPGTGDAQLSLAQTVSITGGVIVTLPQEVSLEDARRGLEMFRQLQIPIFGVVENMSYLELPDGGKMDVFGSGGGEKLAKAAEVDFLAGIPMDPAVRQGGDSGKPIVVAHPDTKAAQVLKKLAAEVARRASVRAFNSQASKITIDIVD